MKKIFLVRHAESEANAAGIMAGSGHDPHLTELGKKQAERAGKDLKGKGIELVIYSPMTRTRETAELIMKEIGYDKKDAITNELFLERFYGSYEGKSAEPYVNATDEERLKQGVEPVENLHARISEGLDWLKTLKQDRILVVSHGTTGRMIKLVAQKLHHSHFHTIDRIQNAEVFEFDLD